MCVSVSVSVSVCKREGEGVCVCVRERERLKRGVCMGGYANTKDLWHCGLLLPISLSRKRWSPISLDIVAVGSSVCVLRERERWTTFFFFFFLLPKAKVESSKT